MEWLKKQFELARGSEPNIRPMEGLRGFAVLLVFLVHYVSAIEPWLTPASATLAVARALHTLGNAGVDLFFVLSGYLIYGSLMARRQNVGRFLRRRAVRIYPAFSAVFLLYLALSYALPAESKIPAGAGAAARYLAQNYFLLAGFMAAPPLITVAWSLSYEMLYYLAVPALIGVFALRARSARWRCAFFALVSLLMAAGFAAFGGPVRLLMFIAGIFLRETLAAGRAGPRDAGALLALLLGMAALLAPGPLLFKTGALFGAFFLLCWTCFSHPRGGLARAMAWTPLRWLGNMSYSFYLLHGLALKAAFVAFAALVPAAPHGPLLFYALLAPMLAVSALASAALFLLVERPLSLAPPAARAARPAHSGARSPSP
ncbi:acyltransferase [Janthinobacterium sp.]|uniref:acyltransferase family protein n=1 Tax=Janthinobacterium sp. TaxID=1871054 RepID=UPI00293D9BB9|nr:acyltransferase [Janthinobacterium sp.]